MGTFEKLFFVCELKSRVAILVNEYFLKMLHFILL